MAKRTPGLRKKGNIWHIEKVIAGQLIRVSTGETELEAAERILALLIDRQRKIHIYGEKVERSFNEASARYVDENEHKKSLKTDIYSLKAIMPYIGNLNLRNIHSGSFDEFIADRKAAGRSAGTITRDLSVVRSVLSTANRLWRDDMGNPWLETRPLLPVVQGKKRKPRPISFEEQEGLLKALPDYLAEMVLFALNTGLRDQELCGMKWTDECKVSGLDTSVFVIEEERAKNTHERIVPLNSVAMSIVNKRRGNKSEFVFDYKGRKLAQMTNGSWKRVRASLGLEGVRIHDLRHTFGMRLRAAGVTYEDRQDLLGHHAGRITTHYSKVEIARLIESVEMLCETRKPELTLVRRAV
jgi:integrase